MNALSPSVLIVEDEFLIACGLQVQVEDFGLEVCGLAASAEEAVAMAQAFQPMLVLMDMRLRGIEDGVDAASAISGTVGSKVIFVTGSREAATVERIGLDQAEAVLFKPVSVGQLRSAIDAALPRA